jgi:hypothetical protein
VWLSLRVFLFLREKLYHVIASEAKQSSFVWQDWIASLRSSQ